MRRIIIDTDTASDDSVAIIMALRAKNVKVEALTVVAGNVPLDIAVVNALLSVEISDTYDVPVYAGESKPLNRELETGQFAHGMNGMGDIELPKCSKQVEEENAVDAMIRIVQENPYEIDIVAIGPLTNVAKAIQKNPQVMSKVKDVYIMGGNAFGEGNMSPHAEFNYYVDAEAVKIVSDFWENMVLLPWNTCLNGVYINKESKEKILNIGTDLSKFVMDINRSAEAYGIKLGNKNGFILADPGIVALLIDNTIGTEYKKTYFDVVVDDNEFYGQQFEIKNTKNNYNVCTAFDNNKFIDLLVELIS